jgi:hypothetical protein
MKYLKLLPVMMVLAMLSACLTEGEVEEAAEYKTSYAERMKLLEEEFLAAEKEGKIVTGVIVEGNSLFNGTTEPQNRPYGEPYSAEELRAAAISAERNSKLFILSKDGTLYYPTCPTGQKVSESEQALRIHRVFTEAQKKGTEKLFTWATLVPMTGREIEICGDIYPGYAGVRGLHIKSIRFEGDYIIGQD